MTQHWNDIGDSDCIMVIGGNPAENHPISFRHVQRAIDAGAKLISVDPRYTRTSSRAHIYAPMRSGTDVAFINGMINYAIQNARYNEKYVMHYANAGFILRNDFARPGDMGMDGLFSGYSWPGSSPGKYSTTTWGYATYPGRTAYAPPETVNLLNVGGFLNLTGTPGVTFWQSGPNAPQVGDTIMIGGGYADPGPYTVTAIPAETTMIMHRAAVGPGGLWPYTHYPVQPANAFLAADIVQDFFDDTTGTATGNAGMCTCSAPAVCPNGWNNAGLSLETPGWKLEQYRAHLVAKGKLPSNAGLTVWESIKLHYSRYDINTVSAITGCPVSTLNAVYDEYTKTGAVGKSGTIMYAMGTTQHTVGTQNIRAYASLQLMLGNTGLRGGGINAMRGESNVQGSTDHCLLFHILPGYLKQPDATIAGDAYFDRTDPMIGPIGHPNQLASYVKRNCPWAVHDPPDSYGPANTELNWWGNAKKYIVSLFKSYWGAKASSANDYCYQWVPKLPGNCSHISIFEKMDAGQIKGLLCFGQNPAVAGPNSKLARKAMRNLDWLVVTDLWETETAAFWQVNEQGKKLTGAQKALINTEVFLLPAACHLEKDGSVVNSSRWTQFRYAAVSPPGGHTMGARHEIEIVNDLYDNIRTIVGGAPADSHPDAPIWHLCMGSWHYNNPYGLGAMGYGVNPPADFIDMEINGFNTATGALIGSFGSLLDNGNTASGNWLYCGSYTGGNLTGGGGTNKAKNRDNTPGIAATYSNWSWSWPVNRRIIYNGASLIPDNWGGVTANSWDGAQPVLVWAAGWTGDVPDGVASPGTNTRGVYIMKNDGHGHLHGFGNVDGPYPEHYEPLENPFAVPDGGSAPWKGKGPNPMGHDQLVNPCAKIWRPSEIGDLTTYPYVCTTYRVSEHWQAGAQTRNLPWLVELVPNVFCEISHELAAAKGISNGDKVKIVTARANGKGKVVAYAVVTNRFKPFQINGSTVHQIGLIWHFGYKGLGKGHSGNILTPHIGDANTMIPEYKAFRCKLVKV